MYPKEVLDKHSPSSLWCELGLHRGVLEEGLAYYLGNTEYVGTFSRGGYRFVLNVEHVKDGPWKNRIKDFSPQRKWEGPVFAPNRQPDEAKIAVSVAAKNYLNQRGEPKNYKPIIKKPTIAYADRPDVSIIATPRAKPTFRPLFKESPR